MVLDNKSVDTPILLIAWRRPHTLQQVIDAIRPVRPTRIFVACDGANPERQGEAEKVAATRALIEHEINWPCHIERLYSDVNQGCRLGVSRAITWFFKNVEEGIILEDDCIPHQDFFPYCTTLLERYRHDSRVWCISGANFQTGQWRGEANYFFGRIPLIWGWATWRRCWEHYDAEISQWHALRDSGLLEAVFEDPLERNYWREIWQKLADTGEPDTWDYQWNLTCIANSGLTALPNRNLVCNVGFGKDATHTTGSPIPSDIRHHGIQTLDPPRFLIRDPKADQFTFDTMFHGNFLRQQQTMWWRLRSKASSAKSFVSKIISSDNETR